MSPTDEQPFLDAVLARPRDDGPRLVYADFLGDTGDPADAARGDLVRVQVALARLPDDHPRRADLVDRQADLLERHAAAWAAPLADLVSGVEFRRGVPDSVSVDAAAFVARGDELFRRTRVGRPPGRSFVRRVRLLDPARVLPRLVQCPFLAAVSELDLCGGDLGNGGVNLLVRSPHLGGVRELDLGFNGLDDAGVRILARASAVPNLHALALNDNGQITWDGVRALADSPFFAGLTRLDLSGNDVNDAGVEAVIRGRATGRLHTLTFDRNHVGDAGVAALAGSSLLRRMLARDPRLDLRANVVGPAGAEALAGCPALAAVTTLDLGGNYLGDRGVIALAASGRLGNVRTLRLSRNQVGDAGAVRLAAAAGAMPELRALDLSGNRLSGRGVEALRAAATARGFALDVTGNGAAPKTTPVRVGEVVSAVLTSISSEDEIAGLRRRVSHPSRPH